MAKSAVTSQPGASIIRMGGLVFFKLIATIFCATLGIELFGGLMSEAQLLVAFNRRDGVSIDVTGVDGLRFQLSWIDFINKPTNLLIFGAPLCATRDFSRAFKWLHTTQTLHMRWRHLFNETFGDALLSFSLYSAYIKRRCEIAEESSAIHKDKAAKYDGIGASISLLTNKTNGILTTFNTMCHNAIRDSIVKFQHFSTRLIPISTIDKYVKIVKTKASALFNVFATLRSIDYSRSNKTKFIPVRERQVFFQILMMFNQRCKVGTDWAAILSIAKRGWGMGKLAASVDSYFGVEVSDSTYATRIGKWTKDFRRTVVGYFKQFKSLVLAYDNCQEGIQLTHQRGGKSSRFKKATSRIARMVTRFLDYSYNNIAHCDITYINQVTIHVHSIIVIPVPLCHLTSLSFLNIVSIFLQIIPSPVGMPCFEDINVSRVDCLLMNSNVSCDNAPEMSGSRVKAYMDLLLSADVMKTIDHCVAKDVVASHIPPVLNQPYRHEICAMTKKQRSHLLAKAKKFQQKSVELWNPQINEASKLLILNVTPIDEGDAKGAGTVVLQLLIEAGVLIQMSNGSWNLADDYTERLVYIFGDCKSNDNFLNFVRNIQKRKLSHDETQAQAEIFLKALSCVIEGPGDWHAGQAMLQALFTLFYGGLLQPMQVRLGWKRIGDQVKDCYYGASRLLHFVLTEVERLFMDMLLMELGATFLDVHGENDMLATYTIACEFEKLMRKN
jgi:hypothetical protein